METLDGETLAHLVDRRPAALAAEDVAWLGLHLASALRYLHGHGLLHLDVKAANVVADAGRAKLIDLSLARPPGPLPRRASAPGATSRPSRRAAASSARRPTSGASAPCSTRRPPATRRSTTTVLDGARTSATLDTDDQRDAGYPQLERPAALGARAHAAPRSPPDRRLPRRPTPPSGRRSTS